MAAVNCLFFGLGNVSDGCINVHCGPDEGSIHCRLEDLGLDSSQYHYTHDGVPVELNTIEQYTTALAEKEEVRAGRDTETILIIRARPRLVGGKGGFGALIRAMGMRVNKSRGRDASRDLSGRRIRDVNAEKQLAEWAKNEPDRKKKKDEDKKKRRRELLEGPKHFFNDPGYMQQLEENEQIVEESVKQGLKMATNGNRKRERIENDGKKGGRSWLGLEGLSSDDSDSEEDEGEERVSKRAKGNIEEADILPILTNLIGASPPSSTDSDPSPLYIKPATVSNGTHQQSVSTLESSLIVEPHPIDATPSVHVTTPPAPKLSEATISSEQVTDAHSSLASKNASPPANMTTPPAPELSEPIPNEVATPTIDQEVIDKFHLDDYHTVEELEEVGPHILKAVLQKMGLKCGGTLNERATRLISIKGKRLDQIDPALFAGKTNGRKKNKGKGKSTKC